MEVHVLSSTTIFPSNSTPKSSEVPLTIFDRFASNIHISVLFAFNPPTATNTAIKDGLSKILLHFPTLSARLVKSSINHRRCVLIGGDDGGGVLVVETMVASELADHIPFEPRPEFQLLSPAVKGAKHLLQVQINRFKCGGLVIGVTAHHHVADGQSMSSFFVAWGKMIRGVDISPLPVYGRQWLEPRNPPRCEFNHWGFEFMPIPPHGWNGGFPPSETSIELDKISNIFLHYSSEYIAKLKALMPEKYTTFETLLGHLWRKITMARGLDEGEYTNIRVAVNGRSRLQPPIPAEFFGNLVLNAYPRANVKGLIEEGLGGAARLVHEAVQRIGEDYVRSFIDFGAVYEGEELVPVYYKDGNVLTPNLEVDSWLGFRFEEEDFGGGGGLVAFIPTWVPVDCVLIFLPTLSHDGGVDVVVPLLEDHARVMRQISHSFD